MAEKIEGRKPEKTLNGSKREKRGKNNQKNEKNS